MRASDGPLIDRELIEKDVPRHGVKQGNDGDEVSEAALRRLLLAYAVRGGDYCQGMNTVAAFLLTVLGEADAFWMFARLIEDVLPDGFYSRDLVGLRTEIRVVRACVAIHAPDAHASIVAHALASAVDDVLLTQCLARLFVHELPRPLLLLVWNALLLTQRGALALTQG